VIARRVVEIGSLKIGGGEPLFILGPCVIESEEFVWKMARALKEIAITAGAQFVFKASYDKANRTSVKSYRGLGVKEGCAILAAIGRELGVPVTTDVHSPEDAVIAAEYIDILQIPAFLCRQTDLIKAAAETKRVVNVKKGQFLAPWDVRNIAEKLIAFGNERFFFTERGTTFGYNNLVADMSRSTGFARWDIRSSLTPPTRCSGRAAVETRPVAMAFWLRSWPARRLPPAATGYSSKLTKIRSSH
jgi:2-dehydro-3-deoxyphosphooctonate aldolase (KDO 8-P synthase)